MTHNDIIQRMAERMTHLINSWQQKQSVRGYPLDNADDPFLSGKVALACATVITGGKRQDASFLTEYRDILQSLVGRASKTWGRYYFLLALYKLKQHSELSHWFTDSQLAQLQASLNWDELIYLPGYTLSPDYPANYYGVAFSIARLRYLLGWESDEHYQHILNRLLAHYRIHSTTGFSDETDGEGRFDRYSILLAAELTVRHIETSLPVPDVIRSSLANAVTLVLSLLNKNGSGFCWGRSIGAYGDSAFMEILTAGYRAGLLNDTQQQAAKAFMFACSERFETFWFDREHQSVNLWFDGRRTDGYRGIHRLLGENMSLMYQHIYTHQMWEDTEINPAASPASEETPALSVQYFAFTPDEPVRGLVVMRDNDRVLTLPLVNGAEQYYCQSPYYPLPFSEGLIAGSADSALPVLLPLLKTRSGEQLLPLLHFDNLSFNQEGEVFDIHFRCKSLVSVSGEYHPQPQPTQLPAYTCDTRYRFRPGSIERRDTFHFLAKDALSLSLFAPVFGTNGERYALPDGGVGVRYQQGALRHLEIGGYENYQQQQDTGDHQWQTPCAAWQESMIATRPVNQTDCTTEVYWRIRW